MMLNKFFIFLFKFKFLKRFIPSLIRKISFLKEKYPIKLDGFQMHLSLKNSIERKIYLNHSYEKEQISYLSKSIENLYVDYFIDIGSYIGYYSLYFYKFNNIKKFIAIEPIRKNFLDLNNNININHFDITTHNVACSNTNEEKKMWYTNSKKMSGSSILSDYDFEYSKYSGSAYTNRDYNIAKKEIFYENIISKKLDDIISINNKLIVVKIDVERHELPVLNGGKSIFF